MTYGKKHETTAAGIISLSITNHFIPPWPMEAGKQAGRQAGTSKIKHPVGCFAVSAYRLNAACTPRQKARIGQQPAPLPTPSYSVSADANAEKHPNASLV